MLLLVNSPGEVVLIYLIVVFLGGCEAVEFGERTFLD
jgi:hypothetical protein